MSSLFFNVISPIDGSLYCERTYADSAEISRKLDQSRRALPAWSATPIAERLGILSRFAAEMAKRKDELATELTWQMGRPLNQADETPRLARVVGEIAGFAKDALADIPFSADAGIKRFARRAPTGVHLAICAWNYPTAMIGNLVAAPLAAGNVVILKHSPQTPTVAEIAEECFRAAGAPDGVFQSLHLDHPDAESLIASGAFRSINFIGSTRGGRRVHAAAGGSMTDVHLELGGKDAAYLRADADLDDAIPLIAEGCFSNSGQSCCSVERIYVQRPIYNEFVERLVEETRKWTVGDPRDSGFSIGPVVRKSSADNIRAHIAEAVRQGARLHLDEGRCEAVGNGNAYIAPNVLSNASGGMSIMREELFGPVACVQLVEDDEEAIRCMNDSDYGLTGSVWTRDIGAGERLLEQVEAGTVYLNRCDHADLYLPWGGMKNSGLGHTNGIEGLRQATTLKSFHIRTV
jgi:acyl-CoA reductase-like NAD-dependent aldehyde dehydrogenase